MVDITAFIIRSSGKKRGNFYIDYTGLYKVTDISKEVKVDPKKLSDLYISHGAVLDEEDEIFYFSDFGSAKDAMTGIVSMVKPGSSCRSVRFTEAEIEYIRKALINDGSGNIGVNQKMKDNIFKKLNG